MNVDKQIRKFTKSDWMGYAGAENFSDGSEPKIAYGTYWTLLACGDPEGGDLIHVEIFPDADLYAEPHIYLINGAGPMGTELLANDLVKKLNVWGTSSFSLTTGSVEEVLRAFYCAKRIN